MVESAEHRSSGAAATAATATATATATNIAHWTASCPVAEFGRWLGLWTSTETVADTIGDRPTFGLFGRFPSTTEATFSRKDYVRETAG